MGLKLPPKDRPWSEDDDPFGDVPRWDPAQSGPEYHLLRNDPPRCLMPRCGMPMRTLFDEKGPYLLCMSLKCGYIERL